MGELTHRGSLYDVVALAARNLAVRARALAAAVPVEYACCRKACARAAPDRARQRCAPRKRNVAHHYDIDPRIYQLFLDCDLQYSCAYFERAG